MEIPVPVCSGGTDMKKDEGFSVEVESRYEGWWRYNVTILCGCFDADGDRIGFASAESVVAPVGSDLSAPPEGAAAERRIGIRSIACDHIVMYVYIVPHILNALVGIYKYFVLGLFSDDFGGGIFWGGGGLNPFCLLLLCFYSSLYFAKKTTFKKFAFIIAATFMLGAMAEEKMMLMLAVLCIILSALINQYVEKGLTVRKLGILVGLLLGFVVVINLVDRLAPDMLNILFNKKNFMDYATATFDEGYRIPRVGSFQVINNLFLRTPIKEWFGLGIGNCDTSAFSFLQSDFYRAYGDYNYRWFTNQWTYLECGIGGFGLYVFFFVTLIITLLAKLKRYPNAIRPYMIASAIFTVAMIFLMWHSSAIRVDTAYIIYFGMAIGFVAMQYDSNEIKEDC